ncbi:hypothetical protein B0T14DRAFT_560230 [Immersiella caudata]|uniref:Uncharacterized protein n=1 Tax=Immersiella caudata TaxID=314043 RepID=A0AA39XG75_9PEZI|nr:hypothetical protein B0T14DRAFT_560230 [Immersiella caudata]
MCYETVDIYKCGHQASKVVSCNDDPSMEPCPDRSTVEFKIGTACGGCLVVCHACSYTMEPKMTNCGVCGHWVVDCERCWFRRASTADVSDDEVVFVKEERAEEEREVYETGEKAEPEQEHAKVAEDEIFEGDVFYEISVSNASGREGEGEEGEEEEEVEEVEEKAEDEEAEREVVVLDD